MEKVIDPIDRRLLATELTPERMLRTTNKADNEIYIVDSAHCPNTMREIGRLRELAFRAAGGGTGLECDIDEFDTMDPPCRQLIVWDPQAREIVGGYRFILGRDIRYYENGLPRIATSHLFNMSERFLKEYLPNTIELGRSFVSLNYQSTNSNNKAIFALDNLWDGLGALTVVYPEIKYLFGKVTMYPNYGEECRNILLYFLNKHFPDNENLVAPIHPLQTNTDIEQMESIFTGADYRENYKILNNEIRKRGKNIPPLVNSYMGLSPTMRMFGTAINPEFGNVEESGIFFRISEIYEAKKSRHIGSYHGNYKG